MCSAPPPWCSCSPAAATTSNPAATGEGDAGTGGSGIHLSDGSGGSGGPTGGGSTTFDSLDDGSSGSSTGPAVALTCTKVDFIFVVDNSSSMHDEQKYLAQGVPGFVSAMQNALPDVQSFRVGVVDTDSYPALGTNDDPLDGCPPDDPDVDCSSCDYQLGALLSKPSSAIDPTLSCGFSTGLEYMNGDADTFANEFGCAALVGAGGNPVEQQAGALVAAVSPDQTGDGGCNAGFIRDDALLVFLVISDEEDNYAFPPAPQGGSMGDPPDWYAAVVAAKDGKESNVVALGLLGGSPKFPDCVDVSQGNDGAEQSSRLVDFMGRFPNNFVGSVCSDGYGAFFQSALDTVAQGCTTFIP